MAGDDDVDETSPDIVEEEYSETDAPPEEEPISDTEPLSSDHDESSSTQRSTETDKRAQESQVRFQIMYDDDGSPYLAKTDKVLLPQVH